MLYVAEIELIAVEYSLDSPVHIYNREGWNCVVYNRHPCVGSGRYYNLACSCMIKVIKMKSLSTIRDPQCVYNYTFSIISEVSISLWCSLSNPF